MKLTRNTFLSALAVYLFGFNPLSGLVKLTILAGLWLADGGIYWLYLFKHTFLRDIRYDRKIIKKLKFDFWIKIIIKYCWSSLCDLLCHHRLAHKGIKMLFYCKYVAKWYNWTVVSKFRESVEKYPHKVMLVNCASGEEWTYTQVTLICIYPLLYLLFLTYWCRF